MRPRETRHRALYLVAPGVLVLIACLQIYRAHVNHLTPWKGGGFGMFSTVDASGTRILRTYLVTDEGEALALYGASSLQEARVLAMPDTLTLDHVAREAAVASWAMFSFQELLGAFASMPEDLRSYLARSPSMLRSVEARRKAREPDGSDTLSADTLAADGLLQAIAAEAAREPVPEGYPEWIAIAQPSPGTARAPEVLQVRVEVWAMRYDQQAERAAPELLNSVTLDVVE